MSDRYQFHATFVYASCVRTQVCNPKDQFRSRFTPLRAHVKGEGAFELLEFDQTKSPLIIGRSCDFSVGRVLEELMHTTHTMKVIFISISRKLTLKQFCIEHLNEDNIGCSSVSLRPTLTLMIIAQAGLVDEYIYTQRPTQCTHLVKPTPNKRCRVYIYVKQFYYVTCSQLSFYSK